MTLNAPMGGHAISPRTPGTYRIRDTARIDALRFITMTQNISNVWATNFNDRLFHFIAVTMVVATCSTAPLCISIHAIHLAVALARAAVPLALARTAVDVCLVTNAWPATA